MSNCTDAEAFFFGGMFNQPSEKTINKVRKILSPSDFSTIHGALLCEHIFSLAESGEKLDFVTINSGKEFENLSMNIIKEGNEKKSSFDSDNCPHYAKLIREQSVQRQLERVFREATNGVKKTNPKQIIADVMSKLTSLENFGTGETQTTSDMMRVVSDSIERAKKSKGTLIGIPTSLSSIDRMTNGLYGGQLVVICGRPSVGKTCLAHQIAIHNIKRGTPVGACHLEMNATQMGLRTYANLYDLNLGRLRGANKEELLALDNALEKDKKLSNYPFHYTTDTYDMHSIVTQITEWVAQKKIKLAVVDHIGLIESPHGRTKNEELANISRRFKKLSKQLDIPIILISQLNRYVEREKRIPVLSDLRESGAIEQDADIVIAIHAEASEDRMAQKNIFIGVLKNRDGERGWCREEFKFEGAYQKIMQINNYGDYAEAKQ